jgi:hypothetical protein
MATFTMRTYIITLKQDNGKVRIKVKTTLGIQNAIESICMAEGCPEYAIINIKIKD